MTIVPNQHQRGTDAACGEHAPGGVLRRLAPVADYAQDGVHPHPVGGASTFDVRLFDVMTSLLTGGGDLNRRSRLFHSRLRFGRPLAVERHKATSWRLSLPAIRLVATNFRCALKSRSRSTLADHCPCKVSDLTPVVQLRRLSSFAGFDSQQRRERQRESCSTNRIIRFTR